MSRVRLADERGAMLPIAAGALAMFLLLGALILDVANWYEHGKTLQIRADSAVLAAGQRWAYPCDATTNANIEATAREYVGSHMRHPPAAGTLVTSPYNNLITTTSPNEVHVLFNSLQYFENGGSDWTDRVDPAQEVTGKPCTRDYLDAKITEENVDGFFGRFAGLSFLPKLSRKARVKPFEVESLEGILPIGVKAFDVRSAAVLFVRKNTPGAAPLGSTFLTKDLTGDSPADADADPDFPGFVRWTNQFPEPTPPCPAPPAPPSPPNCDTNPSAPVAIANLPPEGVGAVIVLSSRSPCGAAGVVPPCLDLSLPTADAICQQGDTDCFDRSGSGSTQTVRGGLSSLEGYSTALTSATPTSPPVLHNVYFEKPVAGGCRDPYYVFGDTPCTIKLIADIRFLEAPAPGGRPDDRVAFHAYDGLGWCPNAGCVFTRTAAGSTFWETTVTAQPLDVLATSGANPFRMRWRMASGSIGTTVCAASNPTSGGNDCDGGFTNGQGSIGNYAAGSFTPVHQIFSANEFLAGPIEVMRVWDAATPHTGTLSQNVNSGSYVDDSPRTLWVDIFLSNVVATSPGDPPIALRLVGSQNGSIDCDPNEPLFSQEFVNGCRPRYGSQDSPYSCPDYNVLWNTPQPWRCVKTQTGNFLGQFTQGLKDRVLEGGNVCVPDNDGNPNNYRAGWNWWNNGQGSPHPNAGTMFPNFEPTDPRLVTLFVTPFGSFQGSGNAIFPITGFGAFYITGWNGSGGSDDPCPGWDPAPLGGYLVGHFIKDVLISGAEPSQNPCNPASLDPCVVALVE